MQGRRRLESFAIPQFARGGTRCRWAKGLTLIELFVVIGMLTVILAMMMPAVASVRRSAMNAVCTARLHELTFACNLYRNEYGRYPSLTADAPAQAPAPDLTPLLGINLPQLGLLRVPGLMTPEDIQTDLLNSLSRYLRFPTIAADSTAADLPPGVQCPTVEDEEIGRETMMPVLTSGSQQTTTTTAMTYYTGYVYVGRLGEGSPAGAGLRLLRPDRPASPKNSGLRAVIWADDVHYTSLGGGAWKFAHRRPNAEPTGPLPLSFQTSRELEGQHRAYTDGSVEWIDASAFDLDDRNVSNGGEGATLEISSLYRWWF